MFMNETSVALPSRAAVRCRPVSLKKFFTFGKNFGGRFELAATAPKLTPIEPQ
jgi:hypothetical protein